MFSLFISFSIGSVDAVWWDSSFTLCKNITIDNTANANTLTNYAVWINITNTTNIEGDFSDIRFVNAGCNQGGSELSYWIEKQVDSNFAETWVEVDSVPASSSKNISMYYNASGVVSKSNIQDTFPVGDDFNDDSFNTTKWNNTVGNYIEDGYSCNSKGHAIKELGKCTTKVDGTATFSWSAPSNGNYWFIAGYILSIKHGEKYGEMMVTS
jgi:hypothetical protein